MLIAPIAIKTVLNIIYNDTQSQSEKLMMQSLNSNNISPITDVLTVAFSKMIKTLSANSDVEMTTGGVYESDEYPTYFVWRYFAQQQFIDSIAAAHIMNGYCSNITYGKITNLIKPKWINSYTTSVLINGFYMDGPWKYPFGKAENYVSFRDDLNNCNYAKKKVELMYVKVTLHTNHVS